MIKERIWCDLGKSQDAAIMQTLPATYGIHSNSVVSRNMIAHASMAYIITRGNAAFFDLFFQANFASFRQKLSIPQLDENIELFIRRIQSSFDDVCINSVELHKSKHETRRRLSSVFLENVDKIHHDCIKKGYNTIITEKKQKYRKALKLRLACELIGISDVFNDLKAKVSDWFKSLNNTVVVQTVQQPTLSGGKQYHGYKDGYHSSHSSHSSPAHGHGKNGNNPTITVTLQTQHNNATINALETTNFQNVELQVLFINKMFVRYQSTNNNDNNFWTNKIFSLSYIDHESIRLALIKNLNYLFMIYPSYFEKCMTFLMNIRKSDYKQYALLIDCAIKATPDCHYDLTQALYHKIKNRELWLYDELMSVCENLQAMSKNSNNNSNQQQNQQQKQQQQQASSQNGQTTHRIIDYVYKGAHPQGSNKSRRNNNRYDWTTILTSNDVVDHIWNDPLNVNKHQRYRDMLQYVSNELCRSLNLQQYLATIQENQDNSNDERSDQSSQSAMSISGCSAMSSRSGRSVSGDATSQTQKRGGGSGDGGVDKINLTLKKSQHPSYMLGYIMAKATEIVSHREISDIMFEKFVANNKIDILLFCENYLGYVCTQAALKVKKNGLTYLHSKSKLLIQAMYMRLVYVLKQPSQSNQVNNNTNTINSSINSQDKHLLQWKYEVMRMQTMFVEYVIPYVDHYGFENTLHLLSNVLLCPIYTKFLNQKGATGAKSDKIFQRMTQMMKKDFMGNLMNLLNLSIMNSKLNSVNANENCDTLGKAPRLFNLTFLNADDTGNNDITNKNSGSTKTSGDNDNATSSGSGNGAAESKELKNQKNIQLEIENMLNGTYTSNIGSSVLLPRELKQKQSKNFHHTGAHMIEYFFHFPLNYQMLDMLFERINLINLIDSTASSHSSKTNSSTSSTNSSSSSNSNSVGASENESNNNNNNSNSNANNQQYYQSVSIHRRNIHSFLSFIYLLVIKSIGFVKEFSRCLPKSNEISSLSSNIMNSNNQDMIYSLYFDMNYGRSTHLRHQSRGQLIGELFGKALKLCRFVTPMCDVRARINLFPNKQSLLLEHAPMLEASIKSLGYYDVLVEINLLFAVLTCMAPADCLKYLIENVPMIQKMFDMVFLACYTLTRFSNYKQDDHHISHNHSISDDHSGVNGSVTTNGNGIHHPPISNHNGVHSIARSRDPRLARDPRIAVHAKQQQMMNGSQRDEINNVSSKYKEIRGCSNEYDLQDRLLHIFYSQYCHKKIRDTIPKNPNILTVVLNTEDIIDNENETEDGEIIMANGNENEDKSRKFTLHNDRLWYICKYICHKLQCFETTFGMSHHLWKYYLPCLPYVKKYLFNNYDTKYILPSCIEQVANDRYIAQSLKNPRLLLACVLNILDKTMIDNHNNGNKKNNNLGREWYCLAELFYFVRNIAHLRNKDADKNNFDYDVNSNDVDNSAHQNNLLRQRAVINQMVDYLREKMVDNLNCDSDLTLWDNVHMIMSSIFYGDNSPRVDMRNHQIGLNINMSLAKNNWGVCQWLFETSLVDLELNRVVWIITQIIAKGRYTQQHLLSFVDFASAVTQKWNSGGYMTLNSENKSKLELNLMRLCLVICQSMMQVPLLFDHCLETLHKKQNIDTNKNSNIVINVVNSSTAATIKNNVFHIVSFILKHEPAIQKLKGDSNEQFLLIDNKKIDICCMNGSSSNGGGIQSYSYLLSTDCVLWILYMLISKCHRNHSKSNVNQDWISFASVLISKQKNQNKRQKVNKYSNWEFGLKMNDDSVKLLSNQIQSAHHGLVSKLLTCSDIQLKFVGYSLCNSLDIMLEFVYIANHHTQSIMVEWMIRDIVSKKKDLFCKQLKDSDSLKLKFKQLIKDKQNTDMETILTQDEINTLNSLLGTDELMTNMNENDIVGDGNEDEFDLLYLPLDLTLLNVNEEKENPNATGNQTALALSVQQQENNKLLELVVKVFKNDEEIDLASWSELMMKIMENNDENGTSLENVFELLIDKCNSEVSQIGGNKKNSFIQTVNNMLNVHRDYFNRLMAYCEGDEFVDTITASMTNIVNTSNQGKQEILSNDSANNTSSQSLMWKTYQNEACLDHFTELQIAEMKEKIILSLTVSTSEDDSGGNIVHKDAFMCMLQICRCTCKQVEQSDTLAAVNENRDKRLVITTERKKRSFAEMDCFDSNYNNNYSYNYNDESSLICCNGVNLVSDVIEYMIPFGYSAKVFLDNFKEFVVNKLNGRNINVGSRNDKDRNVVEKLLSVINDALLVYFNESLVEIDIKDALCKITSLEQLENIYRDYNKKDELFEIVVAQCCTILRSHENGGNLDDIGDIDDIGITEEPAKKKQRLMKQNNDNMKVNNIKNKNENIGSSNQIIGEKEIKLRSGVFDIYCQFIAGLICDNFDRYQYLKQWLQRYFCNTSKEYDYMVGKCLKLLLNKHFYHEKQADYVVNQLTKMVSEDSGSSSGTNTGRNDYKLNKRETRLIVHLINILSDHIVELRHEWQGEEITFSRYMINKREDCYFHYFGLFFVQVLSLNINEFDSIDDSTICQLIDSLIMFLDNASLEIEHLNESLLYITMVLSKLSHKYFHCFPSNDKLDGLKQRFKNCKSNPLLPQIWTSFDQFSLLDQQSPDTSGNKSVKGTILH